MNHTNNDDDDDNEEEEEEAKEEIMTDKVKVVEDREKQSEGSNHESKVRQQRQSPKSPTGIFQGMVTNVLSLTSSSRRSHGKQVEEYDFVSTTCGICLEEFTNGDKICISTDANQNASAPAPATTITISSTDHCDHVFHVDCMLRWLIKNRAAGRCPLCRKTFLSMDEYDNFFQFQQSGALNSMPTNEQDEIHQDRSGESGDYEEEDRDNDETQDVSSS